MIERKPYMDSLRSLKDEQLIKVVTGLRRAGKSTLLEMFADEVRQGVTASQVQFLNFEDPDILVLGDWKQAYDHIRSRLVAGRMNYIFLDEVQNIVNFERLVDGLFIKKNVDIYITGSNANLLSGELATLLTGRYIEISILPFSFGEYVAARADSPNSTKDETLANFIYSGAIPQAVSLSEKDAGNADDYVKSVLNTIIEKDIFVRHGVGNNVAFHKVLDFVLDSVGSCISPRSISDTLRANDVVVDKQTVGNYLDYLTKAFVLYKASRYDVKGRRLLQTLDKYYLADPGFRKVRLGKTVGTDRGHLLENMVYLELLRRNRYVYVGKVRDKEVDFVAMDRQGYLSFYQVAYSVSDEATLERELAPLRAIGDSNAKYLLSADRDVNPVYDGIRKLNVSDWLLGS
ncbi:MAG: ATP-binding protein [Clostridiales bacterium]|nr:ATP-binding protein [Clostridiales bacterium]